MVKMKLENHIQVENKELKKKLAALENFTPTNKEVNNLPEGIRRWVHDLETRCDPAGDTARLIVLEENNKYLQAKLAAYRKLIELIEFDIAETDTDHLAACIKKRLEEVEVGEFFYRGSVVINIINDLEKIAKHALYCLNQSFTTGSRRQEHKWTKQAFTTIVKLIDDDIEVLRKEFDAENRDSKKQK